jgi:hypothetical protein
MKQLLFIKDDSEKTFRYITRWHDAPLRVQKLLPLIMQRSMKSCKMDMGGMFVPSFEGFASVNSVNRKYIFNSFGTN